MCGPFLPPVSPGVIEIQALRAIHEPKIATGSSAVLLKLPSINPRNDNGRPDGRSGGCFASLAMTMAAWMVEAEVASLRSQ